MPDVNGKGRGDLFATVQVKTPKKLTKEQRHLLEQLAKALPKEEFEPRSRGERATTSGTCSIGSKTCLGSFFRLGAMMLTQSLWAFLRRLT
jgi:DnaJ-class molecular chaperone